LVFSRNTNTQTEPISNQNEISELKNELELLKQKQLDDAKVASAARNTVPSISNLISEWRNRTAFMVCAGSNAYTGQPFIQTATAYIHVHSSSDNITANTNRHALLDDYGNLMSRCDLAIPGNPNTITFYPSIDNLHPTPSIDAARIYLDKNDLFLSSLGRKKVCSAENVKVDIGDQVLILGYPSIGGASDITATEGIISSYNYPYYITSAKIDHGNSGGLAILVKNNCFLGLPTGSVVGSIESLGRILDAGAM
jgi:hypothetical protein